jgi:formylglycine-generating enzyme
MTPWGNERGEQRPRGEGPRPIAPRLTAGSGIDILRVMARFLAPQRWARLGALVALLQQSACSGSVSAGPANMGGSAGAESGGEGGEASVQPSCAGLAPSCGPAGGEDCCESLLVSGGSFLRSYDGVTYVDQSHPATVSDFRLDKYEATVARFRLFLAAWVAGWRPAEGAGKHTHLNEGKGLVSFDGAGFEGGWESAWTSSVPISGEDWEKALSCDATYQTWTHTPGSHENRAIDCLNWFEAAAFCIWDNAFLPSEAEWNYASAGGNQQRLFPWSGSSIDCKQANFHGGTDGAFCPAAAIDDVGSESPAGDGRYGHTGLAGNVTEWTLDWYDANYSATCTDCANSSAARLRVLRGGGFGSGESFLLSSNRDAAGPKGRASSFGVRCARAP